MFKRLRDGLLGRTEPDQQEISPTTISPDADEALEIGETGEVDEVREAHEADESITFETIRFLAPSLDGRDLASAEPRAIPADRDAVLAVPEWSPEAARERHWINERYAVASHTELGPRSRPPYFGVYVVRSDAG